MEESTYWVAVFYHLISGDEIYSLKHLISLYLKCEWHRLVYDQEYYSLFRHIARLLCIFISRNEQNPCIFPYIEFLYFLCKFHKIDPHVRDIHQRTPLETYIHESKTLAYETHMTLVLKHSRSISKMQACIRRSIAKRKLYHLRYQHLLTIIRLSPPCQIEFVSLKHFPGGSDYHSFRNRFLANSLGL